MYYTYIVECTDGTYYTGYTVDVKKRLAVHNAGKGAKYTKSRKPVILIYQEENGKLNKCVVKKSKG